MTYSVPYSFVPGTKAKADEVNANFIDILNKIEETNLRIDQANENLENSSQEITEKLEKKIDEVDAAKANLSLSNINSTGKTLFNNKANAADIDGTWVSKYSVLGTNIALTGSSSINVSLSSYLPNDSKVYEVIFATTTNNAGWQRVYIGTDLIGNKIPIATSNGLATSSGILLPVGKDRKVSIGRNANYVGYVEKLMATGYRKVR